MCEPSDVSSSTKSDSSPLPQSSSIYLSHLKPSVTEDELSLTFKTFGLIKSIKILSNNNDDGYNHAYVNYYNIEDALDAVEKCGHVVFDGEIYNVKLHESHKKVYYNEDIQNCEDENDDDDDDEDYVKANVNVNVNTNTNTNTNINENVLKWNVFVSCLDESINSEGLLNIFKPYGRVLQSQIVYDKITNKSKGFGRVLFADENDAQRAIEAVNGSVVIDNTIKVMKYDENRSGKGRLINKDDSSIFSYSSDASFTNVYVKYIPSNVNEESCKELFIKLVRDELKTKIDDKEDKNDNDNDDDNKDITIDINKVTNDGASQSLENVSITSSAFWQQPGVGVSGCFNFSTHKQAVLAVKLLNGLEMLKYYPQGDDFEEKIYINGANDNKGVLFAQRSTKKSKQNGMKDKDKVKVKDQKSPEFSFNPFATPFNKQDIGDNNAKPTRSASVGPSYGVGNMTRDSVSVGTDRLDTSGMVNNGHNGGLGGVTSGDMMNNMGGNGGNQWTTYNVPNVGNVGNVDNAGDYNTGYSGNVGGGMNQNFINDGLNSGMAGGFNGINGMNVGMGDNGVKRLSKTEKINHVRKLNDFCRQSDFGQPSYTFTGKLDGGIIRYDCECIIIIPSMADKNDLITLKTNENSSKKRIAKARSAFRMLEKLDNIMNGKPVSSIVPTCNIPGINNNNRNRKRSTSRRRRIRRNNNGFRSSSGLRRVGVNYNRNGSRMNEMGGSRNNNNMMRNARTPGPIRRKYGNNKMNGVNGGYYGNGNKTGNINYRMNGNGIRRNDYNRRAKTPSFVSHARKNKLHQFKQGGDRYGPVKNVYDYDGDNNGRRYANNNINGNGNIFSLDKLSRKRMITSELFPLIEQLEPKYASTITNMIVEMNQDIIFDILRDTRKLKQIVEQSRYKINNKRF